MKNLTVKRLSEHGKLPTKEKGNAGYDLYSAENVVIPPLERRLVKTGIAIKIPDGIYGHLSDRSGVAWKQGGHLLGKIIDPSFVGEWGLVMYNTNKDKDIVINIGDRAAQVVFKRFEEFDTIEWAEELESTSRGESGWGSSGK